MWPDYREINKITIKYIFSIPLIDEVLYELHGVIYFKKLDIHSIYHHIRIKDEYVEEFICSISIIQPNWIT